MNVNLSDKDTLNVLMSPAKSQTYDFSSNLILSASPSSARLCASKQDNKHTERNAADDTIHYLSPASTTPIPILHSDDDGEGRILPGYFYKSPSFMRYLHEYRVGEASYVSSTISCIEPELQRTLAIVKPEAMQFEDVILRAIVDAGFAFIRKRYIHFTPEQVSEIYSQHYGSPAFPHLVVSMAMGPVLSLCMAGVNAVQKWKDLIGPENSLRAEWFFPMSMRVRFGLRDDMPDALHASENLTEANKENRYVNSQSILEPIISEQDKVTDYLGLYVNPTLVDGLVDVVRVKPIDPILHLVEYILKHNPYQPRFPDGISLIPT